MKSKAWLATCIAAGSIAGAGCGQANGAEDGSAFHDVVCQIAGSPVALPDEVRETSGLAHSRLDRDALWTHNDRGHSPHLYAIDRQGRLVQRVEVTGASNVDWEDLESGPCDRGTCLFIGDIGDNDAVRPFITIYVVPEPEASVSRTEEARSFHARYPDGPEDAESLFLLDGELYIITKGGHRPVTLYRHPSGRESGDTVTLELVREIAPQAARRGDLVTAATTSSDGRWIGIRSYSTLFIYPARSLIEGPFEPHIIDLRPLREIQGEGLAIAGDGTVWVSSEAESRRDTSLLGRLQCTFPQPATGVNE
ncbi:hypothetical protein BH23GEM9_BH23GEM9_26140 [soil metagenome]